MNFAGIEFVPESRLRELETRHAGVSKTLAATRAKLEKAESDLVHYRRESWQWPICLAVGMVAMFLFGTWLAGKVNCPAPPAPDAATKSAVYFV